MERCFHLGVRLEALASVLRLLIGGLGWPNMRERLSKLRQSLRNLGFPTVEFLDLQNISIVIISDSSRQILLSCLPLSLFFLLLDFLILVQLLHVMMKFLVVSFVLSFAFRYKFLSHFLGGLESLEVLMVDVFHVVGSARGMSRWHDNAPALS